MKNLSLTTRIGLVIAALCFLATYKLPFWLIYLTAPQYPEGLSMYIFLHKLTGDIEIINGLNHYIGMQVIDESSFPEFKILPWLIGVCVAGGFLTALLNRVKILWFYAGFVILLSIVAIVDFWKWEYEYGHNLDPNAPISIPGMSYQPPLIGYKKLLNFEAYSAPHGGGWFYIVSVTLISLVVVYEIYLRRKAKQQSKLK